MSKTNSHLTESEMWNIDISCPDGVAEFLNTYKIGDSKLHSNGTWTPPIFLYHETRGEKKNINASALYGGNGSSSVILAMVESRAVLGFTVSEEIDKLIDDTKRGQILSAFAKIDFCLDAMVCIEMDVYANKIKLSEMKNELKNDNGLFSTTFRKSKYLKLRGVLDQNSYSMLGKARKIRNNLAHSYLPVGDVGLEESDIKKHGSHVKAIEYIFNGSWFYLLKAYGPRQQIVVNWLKNNQSGVLRPKIAKYERK